MHTSEPGTLYRCILDGLELLTSDPTVTPIQLKAMASIDQSRLVFQIAADAERHLAENETVNLRKEGMERFVSRAATDVPEVFFYRIKVNGNYYPSRAAHVTPEIVRQIGGVDPSAPLFQHIQGQVIALQMRQVIDLTQPGTEEFTIHGGHGGTGVQVFNVIVNGRQAQVHATHLTYDQVIHLAFSVLPAGENVAFTLTYRDGAGSPLHSLLTGASVHVKEGMIFNVAYTDKS